MISKRGIDTNKIYKTKHMLYPDTYKLCKPYSFNKESVSVEFVGGGYASIEYDDLIELTPLEEARYKAKRLARIMSDGDNHTTTDSLIDKWDIDTIEDFIRDLTAPRS